MAKAWLVGLSAVAVVGLGGCGSTSLGQAVDPPPNTQPPQEAATPTPAQASARQLASVVARHLPGLTRAATKLEACSEEDPALRACANAAAIQVSSGRNFIQDFRTAGSPDPEVASLANRSVFAAEQVLIACPAVGTKNDIQSYGLFSVGCAATSRTLVDDLNGWRPYGG